MSTSTIVIVVSDYNADITHRMLKLAVVLLQECASEYPLTIKEIIHVSGVLEMPLAVKKLLKHSEISGVLVLGAVIQGDTAHDELVAFTTVDKLLELTLQYEKPVAIGMSGPRMTRSQAIARIDTSTRHAVEALVKQLYGGYHVLLS